MPHKIQELFDNIAPHYDRANAILSLGLHKQWNRTLVKALSTHGPNTLLDLCAGTGEIAFSFLKSNPLSSAILLDFSSEMLTIAQKKGTSLKERFSSLVGDAQQVALPDSSIDAISIAYGIRNVASPEHCFREAYRLLRPRGTFAILELTRPNHSFLRLGHSFYLKTVLPLLGKWIAKDKQAYRYLAQSIQSFVAPTDLKKILYNVGFSSILIRPLTSGIATLIVSTKL